MLSQAGPFGRIFAFASLVLSLVLQVYAAAYPANGHRQPGSSTSPFSLVSSPDEFASLVTGKHYERRHDAAVFILSTRPAEVLCPFLKGFNDRFIASNPADVFLFLQSDAPGHSERVTSCLDLLPGFYAIDLRTHEQALGWSVPHHVRDRKRWTGGWPEQYRVMGHWRMTVQFHLARTLGYEFLLQVDDDSEFPSVIEDNLFKIMERDKLKIAGRAAFPDADHVTVGLPELARYFIVTENFQPSPLLYSHCNPASVEGLVSESKGSTGVGWDRTAFYGNFVIYSIKFVHEEMVQRFLKLVERYGGHFMYRWNEQATIGMVWQMFVREGEYRIFDFPYKHKDFTKKRR